MPYSQRYVAFLDILGFREIVRSTEQREYQLAELTTVLREINSRANEPDNIPQFDLRFQTFSDSIVMSVADDLFALTYLLSSIKSLSMSMLAKGLLARGAINKGSLYHDGPVMFGPAFVRAFDLEQSVAKYPRIVIAEPAYNELRRITGGLINPRYLLADDGPAYLDILQDTGNLNQKPVTPELMNSEEAIQAQSNQRILQNLIDSSIHEPKHFEKLKWLGVYWNTTVGFVPNALIPPVTFPGSRNVTWIR